MESGKRSKNFTEREKMLLIEVAKEFVSIIDNKKTDGTSVEAKKQAWMALTNKYNAVSETGVRTEKQLHALYDNLKKKARKNLSDDKVSRILVIIKGVKRPLTKPKGTCSPRHCDHFFVLDHTWEPSSYGDIGGQSSNFFTSFFLNTTF